MSLAAESWHSGKEYAGELVRRISAGDPAAEAQFVDRFSEPLLRLLRHRVQNPWLADDVHQETFCAVLLRLRRASIERPEDVAGFIVATANNILRAQRRRALRDRPLEDLGVVVLDERGLSPIDSLVREEKRMAVLRAIARMTRQRDRDILHRYYIAEESKEAIRVDFGLTDLHFNRVLFRARERLRVLLERDRKLGEIARRA
jgi:RNA polymerase sigma-70 factor (ECF subfamily)